MIFKLNFMSIVAANRLVGRFCSVLQSERVNCVVQQEDSLATTEVASDILNEEATLSVSTDMGHQRLGHLSYRDMCALKNLVSGVDFKMYHVVHVRHALREKLEVSKFRKGEAVTLILELVHSDVCGPMPVSAFGGARYLLTFTDDFSRMTFGYLLKHTRPVGWPLGVFYVILPIVSCLLRAKHLDVSVYADADWANDI